MLEAGALEPLRQHSGAAGVGLQRRLGERHAEQRKALGLAHAAHAVEIQAMAGPGGPELRGDSVAGAGEEMWRGWVGLGEGKPVAALLRQPIHAKATE